MKPSVAVVGAGISGLACATALQAAGWPVSVYDKSRAPAGRMSTRRGEDWQGDHGAQYFTARDPRFQAEVGRWQAAGVAELWQPRLAVIGDEDRHVADLALQRFVGTPRMSSPARHLASSLPVNVQCTVQAIERSAAGWRLASLEQGWLAPTFDALVLALPAPQVIPLLADWAPEFSDRAGGVPMRPCWALLLRYPAPIDLPFDAAFVNRGPLRWVARDSSKPGRPASETWLLHASEAWSETHIDADPAWVSACLAQAFVDLGAPAPTATAIATPHRWRYAKAEPALPLGCCWDAGDQLGLCGDWLNGGKVEGAWLSGHALAGRMLGAGDA